METRNDVGERGIVLKGDVPKNKWIPQAAREIIEEHVTRVMVQLHEAIKLKQDVPLDEIEERIEELQRRLA